MPEIKEHVETETAANTLVTQNATSTISAVAVSLMSAGTKKKSKKRRRRIIKRIIAIVVLLAVLGGGAYGMYELFREKPVVLGDPMTQSIYRGSIQSMVNGSGMTKPKESATITLTSGGTVLEVYVKDGDRITEGDPLYLIDSTTAEEAVDTAHEAVNNIQKQINKIAESYNDLTVRAEHKGMLLDVMDISAGSTIGAGTKIATLVDDSKMKLELYFSYAYEDMIRVGQLAYVSIPSAMNQISGKVTEINYVRRITPEGSILFNVVIECDNPGTLTEGMGASASLSGSDGLEIYPYDGGELKYVKKTDVITKASGTVLSANLRNYSQVSSGVALMQIGAESNDDAITALETQLKTAQETLDRAISNLDNFHASAPMSGTVLSCTLIPGETVETGKVAITIANTETMIIDAKVDEMNVAYVKPGMYCDIVQYGRGDPQYFTGVVESVSLEGQYENGMSYFPAVITVDNYNGNLLTGMGIDYNLVASQSDNCLIAPITAVKYTGVGEIVLLKSETRPDNAVDVSDMGIMVPEGFYAVPVVIGISDNYSVEIVEGLEEGSEVFTQFSTAVEGQLGGMMGGAVAVFRG